MGYLLHFSASLFPSTHPAGTHTKWTEAEGFADNTAKFMATIQGQAYEVCLIVIRS